jgi:glycosyltransferase involved in cell wall biosynthesis
LRILFYDDAPDFGGHELQTLAAARHMASQPGIEVGFMYFRGNARLSRQIADSAALNSRFKPLAQDYASKQFQFVRTLVSGRAIRRIAGEITNFAPDVIVIAQGAIAFCSAGLMAAKKIGLPTISYIPMTHPERVFSESRLRAALREPVNRIYYQLPDAYITISLRMEDYLRRKGLTQPVTVVQAAIDLAEWHTVEVTAARESLGLAAGDWVVALIGRVQFWQKRQDLVVKALALVRDQVPNLKLLLVGDGPDLGALKGLVRAEGVEDMVVFAGWTDGLSVVYSAIDALVIPSRYEGVPLVMLQALYFGRPVIASAVDGMLDILPPHWLFGSGDAAALAARLVEASRARETSLLDAQRDMVIQAHSLPVFERAFMNAIMSATDRIRRDATTRRRTEIA